MAAISDAKNRSQTADGGAPTDEGQARSAGYCSREQEGGRQDDERNAARAAMTAAH
jgi:hypothetical protein